MTDYNTKIKLLSKDTINNKCFDCNEDNPQWTSTSHGIFICINCAATHRSYGVNISRVRSVLIDKWNKEEYELLKEGGNDKFRKYCIANGLDSLERDELYRHDKVKQYRIQFVGVEKPRKYVSQPRRVQDEPEVPGWKSYLTDKAILFKNKSIEFGSKINKQYIAPGISMIKEKATGTNAVETGRRTEDVVNQVETKSDYSKWD